MPVGVDVQTMMKLVRISETEFEETNHGTFRFVPLLGDKADEGM